MCSKQFQQLVAEFHQEQIKNDAESLIGFKTLLTMIFLGLVWFGGWKNCFSS